MLLSKDVQSTYVITALSKTKVFAAGIRNPHHGNSFAIIRNMGTTVSL